MLGLRVGIGPQLRATDHRRHPQHRHIAVSSGFDRRRDGRANAEDGRRNHANQIVKHGDGGGVGRNQHGSGIKRVEVAERVSKDGEQFGPALAPIGETGSIGEVEDVLER